VGPQGGPRSRAASQADSMNTSASNKGMKQTKPSIMELRRLSPVFDGPVMLGTRAAGLG
jgi:hypothetical protein